MSACLEQIQWPITTERLSLRRLREADLEATWHYRQLPEVTQSITSGPKDFETYREQFLEPGKLERGVVVELRTPQGDQRIIGTVMVYIKDGWGQREVAQQAKGTEAELGWCFDPQFAGQGYAIEAVHRVIQLCFEELGLRRVVAGCFAANEPSVKLMERVGMRREAFEKANSLHRTGEWMDSYAYAMLASEFSALTN
ncbi:GNAT family N-acetyltransferase [Glutamicibacter sp. JC586]|uniref:GNAT family N-acetyltransferase n=1 Tax=Glutamicibacter sp. JC586 TaxID=2590552 RepID=UPI001357CBCE|nr:GNAT family N-acetyltransferase [Glutamicibacter sp. JC586]